jgi:hypothetical protein
MARTLTKIQSDDSVLNRIQDQLLMVLNPILRSLPDGIGPMGQDSLVDGVKKIYVAAIKENSKVFITNVNPGTSLGDWVVEIESGVGFTVTSSSTSDTSTFNWWVVGV